MSSVSDPSAAALGELDPSLILRGVDVAPTGFLITDAKDGRLLYINDTMCSILGRSREQLQRLTLFDVMHPEHREDHFKAREAMLAGTLNSYHTEKRYTRPDGTSVWVAVQVVPIRDDDGSIGAFFAQKLDITERKDRDERLERYVSDAVWLGRIRDALDDDRLVLYAQPIVDLGTNQVVQRELLLRMHDEDGSVLLPGEFLPVAERYGLIAEIDRWVIRHAVRIAAAGTAVQFNLSAASITNPDVLGELVRQIELTPVDPSLLVVEVTETAMLERPGDARALAEQVAGLGCGLALDDFGTGFATLSLLKHLPARHLKIDIDFVRGIADDETDQRLVRGIVALAREFGLITTAEGVEDPRAATMLKRLGVHRGQGFLFARPAPLDPTTAMDPSDPPPRAAAADSIRTVREAFAAFNGGDLARIRELSHPAIVLRPLPGVVGLDPTDVFRGYDGLAECFRLAREEWDHVLVTPGAFWEARGAVIVAGEVTCRRGDELRGEAVLWVIRLREGLIASVQIFDPPDLERAPITCHG